MGGKSKSVINKDRKWVVQSLWSKNARMEKINVWNVEGDLSSIEVTWSCCKIDRWYSLYSNRFLFWINQLTFDSDQRKLDQNLWDFIYDIWNQRGDSGHLWRPCCLLLWVCDKTRYIYIYTPFLATGFPDPRFSDWLSITFSSSAHPITQN